MNVPILVIKPGTIPMIAKYHADSGSPETEIYWLRIGLVLLSAEGYNDGDYTETDMHGIFDLAFSDHDDNIRARAYELLERR